MPPADRHREFEPRVMYFGTPVVLVSTENDDGSANLAPMSSAWWVGSSCMLGLDESSQTTSNLRRSRELVLNLADSSMADAVDQMARYTGSPTVPPHKLDKGYLFHADKFALANLTPTPSRVVSPPRVEECAIQLEAQVAAIHRFGGEDSGVVAVEATVVRSHVLPELLVADSTRHIDPDRWDPLIMKFTHLYGGGRNLRGSRLAQAWEIPGPDNLEADRPEWTATQFPEVHRAAVAENASPTRWRMSPGSTVEDHQHTRDEVIVVVQGDCGSPTAPGRKRVRP